MDYKKTLNLPKTEFPMKAGLAEREPELIKFWEEIDLYNLVNGATAEGSVFILHDGPPYANGDIHMGTAFNKVLKDIIVKYKTMTGYYCPYVPGWDCHGQPIEHEVEKRLGKERLKISQVELREKCRDYALKFVQRQGDQFRRLGVRGDFKDPYLTLHHSYEATNIKVFGELYKRGLIYKGKMPIHWCFNCETALAEAEIEYADESSPSIIVKFPLKTQFKPLSDYSEPKNMLIWTTTPWTLPANVAMAVHPDNKYAAVKVGQEIYILASNLVKSVFQKVTKLAELKGKELEGLVSQNPLGPVDSRVVLSDFVALDQGTGIVHIAPGHGQEDYLVGLKHDLPSPMPVDNKGVFTAEAGKFAGKHVFEANGLIIDDLRERGLLVSAAEITHSYPHCWRCKRPVIFRSTEQWFIAMDKGRLRQSALQAITSVRWIPKWSINRITSMVSERPDWCISRQRAWGVPIPVFFCRQCRREVVTPKTIAAVVELFEREGADAWFKRTAKEILPPGTVCPECGAKDFEKENDILDVWFESGISHAAVLKNHPELIWPADLYVEGSDQHRGWFQSSLLTSVGTEDAPPYRGVLTHGFVVDGEGRKMSKSLGNVIDPLDVIRQYGADIVRLWTASADYASDIAISPEILERIAEAYRRVRNTARFLLGNLYDFDPAKDEVHYEELEEIDRWALHQLYQLLKKVTKAYEDYQFYLVFQAIHNFCTVELSSFYLDILKDRLYTAGAKSKVRRSAQTALHEILFVLAKILSPILSFTAEEIWQAIPIEQRDRVSVQLCAWPILKKKYYDPSLEEKWNKLLSLRGEVSKALEMARNNKLIGNSLEAQVFLSATGSTQRFLEENLALLPMIFIVSDVKLYPIPADLLGEVKEGINFKSENIDKLVITVIKAGGKKCERCWNYSKTVGSDVKHATLCRRCVDVLSEAVT